MSFTRFDFHEKITAGIEACNYEIPTPIQKKAIPAILKGHDILGLAQTGTGKTAAFVLPILQRLLKGQRGNTRTLIVAPTRELAEQINSDITKLAHRTGLQSLAVYGGVGKAAQATRLRAGVEIVVACPGRLLDHLRDKTLSLAKIEHLVLDEADHMFDMGFIPDIKRILSYLPAKRQTMLFSATMPEEIRHLVEDILDKPVKVEIGCSRPTTTVAQLIYAVEQKGKTGLLKKIMATSDMVSTLIFTRTKYRAKSLASQLQKIGYAATSLQGNLSQQKRQKALSGFRRGDFKVLVATDIAARGIDVSGISHVINFDMPATVEAYTHRVGRTGRAACTGKAVTFACREDKKIIRQIEKSMETKLTWANAPGIAEETKDNVTPAGVVARKSSHKARENRRTEEKRHGRKTFKKAAANGMKQDENLLGKNKRNNRKTNNRRAALMVDGAGKLFLNS